VANCGVGERATTSTKGESRLALTSGCCGPRSTVGVWMQGSGDGHSSDHHDLSSK